jgi:16S rRNA G966 N2-methylase RsmD
MARLPVVLMCPAGFERVVAEIAGRDLAQFEPAQLDSGYIRALTAASVSELREFRCATNVFHVLVSTHRTTLTVELQRLSRGLRAIERPARLPSHGSFRLRVHDDGRFASQDSVAARNLESQLASWSGLQPSRDRARIEFWVLRRRGHGESVLTTKLTTGNSRVPAGVLRPEVCAALARVVPLDDAELVLDPFAGSGSLGIACLQAGARRALLNDSNPTALGSVRTLPRSLRERVQTTAVDCRDLVVGPASVSAIVTDPPWGQYERLDASVASLYEDIADLAARVLVTGGAMVVLTGAGPDAIHALFGRRELTRDHSFPVLINGRKAQIVTATRA